jgi:hypothetical protein
MKDTGPMEIRISISPEQTLEFLERLAYDDEFRARLEEDAGGLLREYGIEVPPEAVPATVEAPPKDDVERALRDVEDWDKLGRTAPQPHVYKLMWLALGHAMPLVAADEAG